VVVGLEAGGVEECDGSGDVVGVLREIGVRGCGPVAGRQERVSEVGVAAPESGDEGRPVDRGGDGLADARVLQGGVLDVEVYVVDACAGAGGDAEVGLVGEGVHHVHGENVALDVG
jgi:hypothetical protein